MENNSLYKLVNPPFDFEFNGTVYPVKKANLEKAVLYQKKYKELLESKDESSDLKLIAYCIYLVLRDHIPSLTEQQIMEQTPADINVLECLTQLGFMSPQKMDAAKKVEELARTVLTTQNSSSISQTGQDGLQK